MTMGDAKKDPIGRRAKMLLAAVCELTELLEQFVKVGESIGAKYPRERKAINNGRFLITTIKADQAIISFKTGKP